MFLRTLGGLVLEGSSFRRQKPLLVLAFLDEAIGLAPLEETRTIFRDLVSGWFAEVAS